MNGTAFSVRKNNLSDGEDNHTDNIDDLPDLWSTGISQAETHRVLAHEAMFFFHAGAAGWEGNRYSTALDAYDALMRTVQQIDGLKKYTDSAEFSRVHVDNFELASQFVNQVHISLEKQAVLQALYESSL